MSANDNAATATEERVSILDAEGTDEIVVPKAVVPAGGYDVTVDYRRQFSNEMLKLLGQTVAKDASPTEVLWLAEVAGRLNLDPLRREIWMARVDGRPLFMVGRDGLLTLAKRDPRFLGLDGDVVHKQDTFEVERMPNGDRRITHKWGNPASRGDIVGAWAELRLRQRGSGEEEQRFFFFAPMGEYKRDGNTPWKKQASVMILKCAQSTVLRIGIGLSGLYGEDAERMLDSGQNGTSIAGPVLVKPSDIEWGDEEDPALAQWLRRLFDSANAHREMTFSMQKIRLSLGGADHARREQIAKDLVEWHTKKGLAFPPKPSDAEAAEAAQAATFTLQDEPAEPVEDAEVEEPDDAAADHEPTPEEIAEAHADPADAEAQAEADRLFRAGDGDDQ